MESWVIEWLSEERLRRYLIAAGHNDDRALRLYEWNANVNASLLHDFAHFEVGVRNLYDRGLQLSLRQGENHWFEDIPLRRLFPHQHGGDKRSRDDVGNARSRAGGYSAPPGAILAEMMFGFWANLTAHRVQSTVWPYLKQVLPNQTDRAQLHDSMAELNRTRNRVAHHEPVDSANVQVTLRRMKRIAKYVSPEFAAHLESMSTVRTLLAQRP
ncbi:hypothetical protein BI49514_00294 [Brevibacterium iodinum ATCC 49514]|uniref:Abi-like protein n=1 Tax=Brevibacterium iodinum ATCC 49514 TaxID=1255616 RepID=A0A2H1HUD2_9MICO|nr:hypothetical protein BI49514_00294 [Brevibacterium iodinum ATCC 49514]SUW13578.1 Abi-like protein [Brevibacterium iodinum]